MNLKTLLTFTVLVAGGGMLFGTASLGATLSGRPQVLTVSAPAAYQIETVVFSDSKEAVMLHSAYRILATGDHDYKGHRAKAMHAVEAAAKLLGLDLKGDAKDHEVQVLSDDKLREAKGLLESVLNNSEVKAEPRITKHVGEAIKQINVALEIR